MKQPNVQVNLPGLYQIFSAIIFAKTTDIQRTRKLIQQQIPRTCILTDSVRTSAPYSPTPTNFSLLLRLSGSGGSSGCGNGCCEKLLMSTPTDMQSEAADRENVVASEHDTSPPPTKVTRADWIDRSRKHLETENSQESERSDEDFSAGDVVKSSETASDRSDSPAAESDRITPMPDFECNDSDDSERATQCVSDRGDMLKDAENITESSDSSHYSGEQIDHDELSELHGHFSGHPTSPLATSELTGSSNEPTTPCFSQADRVTSLRKRMAIHSPSDSILSPCTLKLNRPKNFFRMRQKAKALSLLSADKPSEENDDDADEMECTAVGEADIPAEDGMDKASGEDTAFIASQEDSGHDDI
ncbi:Mitosis-specific protein [Dirofilaria immitis]